ncbi:uncharacterized protein [Oscarella lobularis]|uniref:uncharacterized protein n=1 Tax=Oscarella lobularis TaxID=121494 RepID=UPI003313BB1E
MPWKFKDEDWYRVTFIYRNAEARSVALVGDFCGWDPSRLPMSKTEPDEYRITLPLIEGYYKYKFLVDGTAWVADPNNPHRDETDYGNSIMFVHMDPAVCVWRECHAPHRAYSRPNADGSQFRVIQPEVTSDIAAYGILRRPVFVYLPLNYDVESRYPVLYVHDGQNVFSTPGDRGGPMSGGWYLDEKLDRMWAEGILREFILVAIPNVDGLRPGNRMREYCTGSFLQASKDPYIRYLVECVKPTIDENFRTLSEAKCTATMGASMGGLVSFTLAMTHDHVFGNAACLSPSFWFADCHNVTSFDLLRSAKKVSSRIYVDSGNGQGDNMYETLQMAELMRSLDWKEGDDFEYFLDACADRRPNGITHSEETWRDRVHLPLKFIFGK